MSPYWGSMHINRQRMAFTMEHLLLLNVMRVSNPVLPSANLLSDTNTLSLMRAVLEALLVNEECLSCIMRQHGCPSVHDPAHLYISDAQSLHWNICLTYKLQTTTSFPHWEKTNCQRNHLYIFCKHWNGTNLWGSYNCSLSERWKLIIW